jgi:hypothetical protein
MSVHYWFDAFPYNRCNVLFFCVIFVDCIMVVVSPIYLTYHYRFSENDLITLILRDKSHLPQKYFSYFNY